MRSSHVSAKAKAAKLNQQCGICAVLATIVRRRTTTRPPNRLSPGLSNHDNSLVHHSTGRSLSTYRIPVFKVLSQKCERRHLIGL